MHQLYRVPGPRQSLGCRGCPRRWWQPADMPDYRAAGMGNWPRLGW